MSENNARARQRLNKFRVIRQPNTLHYSWDTFFPNRANCLPLSLSYFIWERLQYSFTLPPLTLLMLPLLYQKYYIKPSKMKISPL